MQQPVQQPASKNEAMRRLIKSSSQKQVSLSQATVMAQTRTINLEKPTSLAKTGIVLAASTSSTFGKSTAVKQNLSKNLSSAALPQFQKT